MRLFRLSSRHAELLPSAALKFVATSVVRGTRQGDSHGGVYLVDFERQSVTQHVDWNSGDIDFQGRGWDRGLRGIAFDGERIYVAASDELFVYDPAFRPLASYRNRYLKHAHEICRYRRHLYVTSTGFNAVLAFDLDRTAFVWGLYLTGSGGEWTAQSFDPASDAGPPFANVHHLNNVFADDSGLYISGRATQALLRFNGKDVHRVATLPAGVHNARPFQDGILFNDTESDALRFESPAESGAWPVPVYDESALEQHGVDDSKLARQGFGRGLAVVDEHCFAAGSSPSTIALYDRRSAGAVARVNLTMDIRNAIHGLELWPY